MVGFIDASRSGGGGLITGMEIAKAIQENKRKRGLAAGMQKVANGDKSGWQQVAENSPDLYMQKLNQDIQNDRLKWDQEHRNDITPYQQAMLGLQRQAVESKEKEKADALAKQQEEEQMSLDNAQAGVQAMQEVADAGNLTKFQDSWFNKWDKNIQADKGALASAIAAVAPRAIAKLKAAGVSGVNTLGEFMTYVGLPQNATSAEIGAAVPMIAQIIGADAPISRKESKNDPLGIME